MPDEELQLRKVLRALLQDRRLTIKAVGDATNTPRSTLNEWLTGSSPRDLGQCRRVARYFGVTLEYLLFGDDGGESVTTTGDCHLVLDGVFRMRIERIREHGERR